MSPLGPDGEALGIVSVHVGAAIPRRVLVVMSGVHGVEAFIGSAMQVEMVESFDESLLGPEDALVLVHGVNPWGMAWGRRQNESNVDLNRNWRRDTLGAADLAANPGYAELHPLICPDSAELPDPDDLLAAAWPIIDERGMRWARDAVATGQYTHADGLHFGGDRTEESSDILDRVVTPILAAAETAFILDLHTGHGEAGTITMLSDALPGSDQDRFLRAAVGEDLVETTGVAEASLGRAAGQLAQGLRDTAPTDALAVSTCLEVGTVPDLDQLLAGYQELWVHRHGDRRRSDHAAALVRYRRCFTPDDVDWEANALTKARPIIQAVSEAVFGG